MKQYCRYCGWLRDIGFVNVYWCEAREKEVRSIKSPNKCGRYEYCGLDENQQEHRARAYKRKK